MNNLTLKERKEQDEKNRNRPIWINISRKCVRDYHDGKEWGDWEKIYVCDVLGFSKSEQETKQFWANSWDVFHLSQSEYERIDDTLWVVAVTYGDGDTFGESSGELAIACATVDYEKAAACAEAIKKDGSNRSKEFDSFAKLSPGICASYAAWSGYFNSLEGVEIIKLSSGATRIKVV
jgi:hypothetical protein